MIFKFIEAIKRPLESVPPLVAETHEQTKLMWTMHDLIERQSRNIETLIAGQMALEAGIGHGIENSETIEQQALRVAKDTTFGTSIDAVMKSDPVFFKDVLTAPAQTAQDGVQLMPANRRVDFITTLFNSLDQVEQSLIFERLMSENE